MDVPMGPAGDARTRRPVEEAESTAATAPAGGGEPEPAPAAGLPPEVRGQGPAIAAVAVGGAIGACARYGAGLVWPTAATAFPLTTLLINVVGCAVIGVFMVTLTVGTPHPLLRPFFGTGVLGGFTTFSTYAVDARRLVTNGHPSLALLYLVVTAAGAMAAVWLAAGATRRFLNWRTTR